MNPIFHTIKLRADSELIEDLQVEDVVEGAREKGVLVGEGGVRFRTPANKPFFIRFSEFSFVVNPVR